MKTKHITAILSILLSGMLLCSCGAVESSGTDSTASPLTDSRTEGQTEKQTDKQTEKLPEPEEPEVPYMIETFIDKLRDPFVLEHNDRYYVYGTGWKCYKSFRHSLDGTWMNLGCVVETPPDAQKDNWAPEVYKYNGQFYMFTTYYSSETNHRGCAVFSSPIPDGPFKLVSDGHVTPSDWDAIDGTLYIDREGQPWMVFVHEWTSMPGGNGAMAAAKLSDDLTHFISEPIELFRAKDAPWANSGVTDGCFMYECSNGELVMLWSNFGEGGYCVGVARSDNGRIDGNWSQDPEPLYSKKISGKYDGGHPMIFETKGIQYMAIHSPNSPDGVRKEKPVFIPITEENGIFTLIFDKKPIATS